MERDSSANKLQRETNSDNKKEKLKSKSSNNKVSIITTNEQLSQPLDGSKTSISFDPSLTAVQVPFVYAVPLSYIIEALKDNETVTSLSISPRSKWDKKDLKALAKCLSGANRGIKKLIMRAMDFEGHFMETICKILMANSRIKTIEITGHNSISAAMDGFKIFCNNMAHFKFEEFIVTSAFLSKACYDLLIESLKSNPSLKIIKFAGEPNLEEHFTAICDLLVSNAITEFWHWGDPKQRLVENCAAFKRALNANYLQKLKLEGIRNNTLLELFYEELKTNTSITDLTLCNIPISWKHLGDAISTNKNIKRLELKHVEIFEREILMLDLASNKTMTDLTIGPCSGLDYTLLFSELYANQTLQKLEVESTHYMASDPLKKYLSGNHSLKELKIVVPNRGHMENDSYRAIAEALRVNRTLRKIAFKLPRISYQIFSELIEALKINTTLTELHITRIRDIGFEFSPLNGNSADDFFFDLLKTNKTLRFIEGASEYPYLEDRLKENRKTQDRAIRNTCTAIKMIVARPNLFPLPIEIWLQIFEHVSYPFVPFDFVQYFRSNMDK
jgi:hypothetical protein